MELEQLKKLAEDFPNDSDLGKEFRILINNSSETTDEKYLRLYAEFENYKKRTTKDKEEIRYATKRNVLNSVLDLDNDISIILANETSPTLQLLSSKVESFLKSHNIERIQTLNYDTDLHEVISIVPGNGEAKILNVASNGYTIDGKIERYPKVILSK